VQQHGTVETRLTGGEIGPIVFIGHAPAGAERFEQRWQWSDRSDEDLRALRHADKAVGIDEDCLVLLWEREDALGHGLRGIVNGQEAGHRLLLQPFARVALGGSGAFGKLGAGGRALPGE
jgi:hypothetical protein